MKKFIWLLASLLMVATLLLASCAPAAPAEEEKPAPPAEEEKPAPPKEEEKPAPPEEKVETVKVRLTKIDGTVMEKTIEKPRYGGVFTQGTPLQPQYTDENLLLKHYAPTMQYTNEELIIGDWAKGPTGTGETTWTHNMYPPKDIQRCWLAESWELRDPETLVYHIRKGVHFQNKPPVNGREMNAEDVVFSMKRIWTSKTAYPAIGYPWKTHMEELNGGPWIEATDKWTVVIKCKPGKTGSIYEMSSTHVKIVPPEVFQAYGDKALEKWENAVGTGPFLLTDYVPASSFTVERNPNYWATDPMIPENRLPYVDGMKYLVISDLSTRMAALRTGKIDWLGGYWGTISWEDAKSLKQTNPELKYVRYLYAGMDVVGWRMDRPELPFADIRVRHALAMAINQQELIDTIFGGDAELFFFPTSPYMPETMTPFDQYPESMKELYTYHPDKAKQLLAEAGYPNGFKTEIICTQPNVDMLSIIKAYFADIGVDMAIDVKEQGVFTSMSASRTYNEMIYTGLTHTTSLKLWQIQKDNRLNPGAINDPRIEEAVVLQARDYFDEAVRRQRVKELTPYFVEQCYDIQLPTRYVYTFWQPWVKGYNGEHTVGYSAFEMYSYFLWIDQNMKEEMTGRR